jgi:hypothetical protein
MVWSLEVWDVSAREVSTFAGWALFVKQGDGLRKVLQFLIKVRGSQLGFGSEDNGIAPPLQRSRMVSKIVLMTKSTYQNRRHSRNQW